MADQGKWFKLWVNALTDPTLEELDTEQWFRWVRLGVFIKAHGEAGELTFASPGRALQNLLRIDNFLDMIKCINKLPGYVIEENVTPASPAPSLNSIIIPSQFKIKCKNWHKYQGDFSVKRTRKWRAKSAVTGDGKSDDPRGEEKRGEEKRPEESIKPTVLVALFLRLWDIYPKKKGKPKAQERFLASIRSSEDAALIERSLKNYLASRRVAAGFAMDGERWFQDKEWRSWIDFKDEDTQTPEQGGIPAWMRSNKTA